MFSEHERSILSNERKVTTVGVGTNRKQSTLGGGVFPIAIVLFLYNTMSAISETIGGSDRFPIRKIRVS